MNPFCLQMSLCTENVFLFPFLSCKCFYLLVLLCSFFGISVFLRKCSPVPKFTYLAARKQKCLISFSDLRERSLQQHHLLRVSLFLLPPGLSFVFDPSSVVFVSEELLLFMFRVLKKTSDIRSLFRLLFVCFYFWVGVEAPPSSSRRLFFLRVFRKGGLKGRSWLSLDALMFADLSSRIWSERVRSHYG